MAIPDYQTCMMPLLRLASDGQEHHFKDAAAQLARQFNVVDRVVTVTIPESKEEEQPLTPDVRSKQLANDIL